MKTSKEQMSKYLERMQYLQRVCLGHSVQVDSHYFNYGALLTFTASWVNGIDTECKCFFIREWQDKEENDILMKECVDFLSNVLKWF